MPNNTNNKTMEVVTSNSNNQVLHSDITDLEASMK